MNSIVKIVITSYELSKLDPGMESMYIVSKLRAARVPVLGMFEFKGVGLIGSGRSKINFKETPLFIDKRKFGDVVNGLALTNLPEFQSLALYQVPGATLQHHGAGCAATAEVLAYCQI